jgi:RimJ/RimL family protein N-acetyltransferase
MRLMAQIGSESTFLIMDERGMRLNEEQMRANLEGLAALENNVLLLALADEKAVGFFSVKASEMERVRHIGEFAIAVERDYWGFGIGPLLMEEGIEWAHANGVIRRLELTVQKRNARAVKLYERFGFKHEALMKRGAFAEGEFLDVHLMSMMID